MTTVEEIVEAMESQYGKANRIWVMDRGMVSAENVEFLKQGGRRYILGTAKGMLRKFEQQLLASDWREVHEGLEVKLCPAPDGDEVFILCRSAQRRLKEQAMHDRFEQRIEQKLEDDGGELPEAEAEPAGGGATGGPTAGAEHARRRIVPGGGRAGRARARRSAWSKRSDWRDWARLSEGCYLLRSNVTDWTGEELWRAYIQLTEAEAAFRMHKSDLVMRPIWHQKEHRVQAHILVCFLAYVLWKTLGRLCHQAGLGDEPRKVFAELQQIALVDVVLPTRTGVAIRKRCVSRPTEHQAILLQRLGLELPTSIEITEL